MLGNTLIPMTAFMGGDLDMSRTHLEILQTACETVEFFYKEAAFVDATALKNNDRLCGEGRVDRASIG